MILSLIKSDFKHIVNKAHSVVQNSGVVAYSTESFYALGVLASDKEAIKRLFAIKKRPPDKALPLIVGDKVTLLTIVKNVPDQALPLINRYWPGPLTLVFEAEESVPRLLTGGTGKVAVRIPGESTALDLARSLKLPLTATSANPSSLPPADSADLVINYFGKEIDLLIDSGRAPGGMPSTIVDVTVTPPKVLRKGSIEL